MDLKILHLGKVMRLVGPVVLLLSLIGCSSSRDSSSAKTANSDPKPAGRTQQHSETGIQDSVGGSSDGGGKGILCSGAGKTSLYLADTFAIRNSEAYRKFKVKDPLNVVLAIAEIVNKIYPEKIYEHPWLPNKKVSLGWMIVHRHSRLFWIYADYLPDLPDDHIDASGLPSGCRKVQIAIQDIASGAIRTNFELGQTMSFLDRGLLEVHETLLNIRGNPRRDTTSIRNEVLELFKALNDPRLSMRELIAEMLSSGKKTPQDEPSSWAENHFFNNCQGWRPSFWLSPGLHDTSEVVLCRQAKAQYDAESDLKDLRSAIPTIIQWPKNMRCRTTYPKDDYTGWKNPGEFTLERVVGDGRPTPAGEKIKENIFRLQFISGGVQYFSTRTYFATYRHHAQNGTGFGIFDFNVRFDGDLDVLFDRYVEQTGEFIGSIQRWNGKYLPHNPKLKDADFFKIACFGDAPIFGIDMENSTF